MYQLPQTAIELRRERKTKELVGVYALPESCQYQNMCHVSGRPWQRCLPVTNAPTNSLTNLGLLTRIQTLRFL